MNHIEHLFNDCALAQIVVDPILDIICAANKEACKLFSLDVETVTSMRVSKLFAPSFPDLVVFTEEVIYQGRAWSDSLAVSVKEGQLRLEITARCRQRNGKHRVFISLQDCEQMRSYRDNSEAQRHFLSGIGHWNRVSHVFQEFERQNQLILDAVGEGIYGVDANGITTFVNPTAQRILGYSAEELAGRNMHSMIHHSRSDGSNYCVEHCPIFKAFQDGMVHVEEDDIFWSKKGKPIAVQYTSTPIEDNGFIVGAVIVFRDTSQLKADRQRLLEALKEVESLKNRLELENAYLQEEINSEFNHRQIVGKSAAVHKLLSQIDLVAPTDACVLICGESGTGKELIARAIHEHSARSQRSLIRVNCAAIADDLFESEFFGHAKGAFTGAISDRPGRFELADGGTLFLDEVGEISLHLQGKLLRVLQEQQFERVGESRTRNVDVRIIAATNRDLKQEVISKRFREDLYFRLNVFPIFSAPLRERVDDIPLLTHHFLSKANQRAKGATLKIPLTEIEKLKAYRWPGNIRELENVVERQVILAKGGIVRFDHLHTDANLAEPIAQSTTQVLSVEQTKNMDRRNLICALEKTKGKVFGDDGAAALLGMKPTTLSSRLKRYNIDARQFKLR